MLMHVTKNTRVLVSKFLFEHIINCRYSFSVIIASLVLGAL
jgi:hypothetical protein